MPEPVLNRTTRSSAAIFPCANSFFAATKQAPDPSGIYFVFTSNFPVSAPFCAFHAYLVQSPALNVPITQIAYVPNTTNVFACDPTKVDPFFEPNSDSQGTQAMATLVAHEFMETITDPLGNAWYGGFDEIGDRCTWLFQSAVPLTDGSRRKVQAEWSNQVNGCDQGAGLKVQVLGAVGAVSKSGTLTTFSSPGGNYGTFGVGINKTGTFVGNSPVDDFSNFGVIGTLAFVRDVSGVLTTFDAPGATGATYANDINSTGTITGGFYDATGPVHGFTRNPIHLVSNERMQRAWMSLDDDVKRRREGEPSEGSSDQRAQRFRLAYVPTSCAIASVCPCIAASRSFFWAAERSCKVTSSAYSLKK